VHPNGATAIGGVIIVSENPQDHRHFLSAFSGVNDVTSDANEISVHTPRGEIRVMTPAAYARDVGTEPPDLARGAHLAAIRFVVRDKAAAMAVIGNGGVPVAERNGRAVLPPDVTHGATLIFETA
jgi:hypothetical protein